VCALVTCGVVVGGGEEGLLVVGMHVLEVEVVLVVLLSGDGAAAVAELAEGVVEVAAVEAHPVAGRPLPLALPLLHANRKD
jgi:hypothetical protein